MKHITSETLSEIHLKMGRNLFRYQQIEFFLKNTPPEFLNSEFQSLDLLTLAKNSNNKKTTLGPLISDFNKNNDFSPDFFKNSINDITRFRNELIHGFFDHPDFHFVNIDGISKAIQYLDNQFEYANEFFEFTRIRFNLFLLFDEINEAKTPEEAEQVFERRKETIHPAIEIICDEDPSKTLWYNTRIVRALEMAESHAEKIGNMTSLASADNFIKNNFPDLKPEYYGLKKLSEVILHSDQFDFTTLKDNAGKFHFVYKSKESL